MTSTTNHQETTMKATGTGRRLTSAATFATAAILVTMVVQLIVALVLSATISIWGLLSVTLTESAAASSIGLGFSFGQTLLLWLLLTIIGVLPWDRVSRSDSGSPADSSPSAGR